MDMKDAHIGIQVADLEQACGLLNSVLGLTFADPILGWPVRVKLGAGTDTDNAAGSIEESVARFTVSRQGPPFLEVSENSAGSRIWHSSGQDIAFHHVGFWVSDVEAASQALKEAGYPMEAAGLNEHDGYRYAYHLIGGLRVEVCDANARPAFERWATAGRAEGVADEFNPPVSTAAH